VEEGLMNERLAELRELQDNISAERRDLLLGGSDVKRDGCNVTCAVFATKLDVII
jgi:hypothetical protein